MIHAVTFDLWQTLIADTPELDAMRTGYRTENTVKLLSQTGYTIELPEVQQAHAVIWRECARGWEKAIDLPFKHQVSDYLELIRPGLSGSVPAATFDAITDAYAAAALVYPPTVIAGADRVLAGIRARGCRLGLICNTGRTPGFILRQLLTGYGIMESLDVALFSDETIVRKPDARIFAQALQQLDARPENSLHVGDDPVTDIAGARGAGMSAVWIRRPQCAEPQCLAAIDDVSHLPGILKQVA